MRNSVVLPQPLGPSSEKNSPALMSSDSRSTARTAPNFFTTPSMRSSGCRLLPAVPASLRPHPLRYPSLSFLASPMRTLGTVLTADRRRLMHATERDGQRSGSPDALRRLTTAPFAMNAASASRSAARHRQAELGAAPQDIVGKTRPFPCHEIAHFGAGQLGTEGGAELVAGLGLAQDRRKPRAIGRDQTLRLRSRRGIAIGRARARPRPRIAPRRNRRRAAAPSRSSAATSDRTASVATPPARRAAARW